MTAKKDLKRLVRERKAKTGESYTSARAHVTAAKPGAERPPRGQAFEVEELIDLGERVAGAGLTCPVRISSLLDGRVEPGAALARLRDALLATDGDPGTRRLCAAALRGARPRCKPVAWQDEELRWFLARAIAGIGGVDDAHGLLALPMQGPGGTVMVLCMLAAGRSDADATHLVLLPIVRERPWSTVFAAAPRQARRP